MTSIILFILVGAFIYYIFRGYAQYETYSQEAFKNFSATPEAIKHSDLGLFVALVAKVAKADGKVDNLEAELIGLMFSDVSSIFPEPEKTRQILKDIFSQEKNRTDNTQELADRLGRATHKNRVQQEKFIAFLIQLAFADGIVTEAEEDLLKLIAEALQINPQIYHKVFNEFEKIVYEAHPQESTQNAYEVLGVKESDDMKTIKKAYRNLVRQYHPDIIKSQTDSQEYLEEATRKTQEINQAYEMIKKARGE